MLANSYRMSRIIWTDFLWKTKRSDMFDGSAWFYLEYLMELLACISICGWNTYLRGRSLTGWSFSRALTRAQTLTWALKRHVPNPRRFLEGNQRVGVIHQGLGVGQIHLCRFSLRIDDFEEGGAAVLIGIEPRV